MTRLLLVGPPGAGKGTQAAVLSEKLSIPHISTGELFRAHINDETDLGRSVKKYLDAGQLVPDEVTNQLVIERLGEPDINGGGFLLDGFPRSVSQADVLGKYLAEVDKKLDAVVQLEVDEEIVVGRLLSRGRTDDTEEVIRHRQTVYHTETEPLLDYYQDILLRVDGVGEVSEVTSRVLAALRDRT